MKPKFNIGDKVYYTLYDGRCYPGEIQEIVISKKDITYNLSSIGNEFNIIFKNGKEGNIYPIDSKDGKGYRVAFNEVYIKNRKEEIAGYEEDIRIYKKELMELENETYLLSK